MGSKECRKCNILKPLCDFHNHKGMKDGHTGTCKLCAKEYYKTEKGKLSKTECQRRYSKTGAGRLAARKSQSKYNKTDAGRATVAKHRCSDIYHTTTLARRDTTEFKALHNAEAEKYRLKYPKKCEARKKVGRAVRIGELIKPTVCSRCGKGGRIEGHHKDYSKPLEVEWLCHKCHSKEHKK